MEDENEMLYMNELEISEFVSSVVKHHEFLYKCLQDGDPVKEQIIKKLGRFRLTDNEIALTSIQLTEVVNEVAEFFLSQTMNALIQNEGIELYIREDGQLCMGVKGIPRQDKPSESQPK